MELDVFEDFLISQEMNFRTALFGLAHDLEWRHFHAFAHLDDAINGMTAAKLHRMLLAIAANGQTQPLRQRIDARNTNAVQTTGNLVGVLVELTAGMQFRQRDFGRRTLGFVFVVHFDADRDTPAVVGHTDRIIRVNGDYDVITMSGQCFVNRVVDNFENKVMQTCTVGSVTDVHPRTFTNCLQAFKNLNTGFTVTRRGVLRTVFFNHCMCST